MIGRTVAPVFLNRFFDESRVLDYLPYIRRIVLDI